MFLSNLSIKHPVFATMMMAALAVLGIASYDQLKVDFFPKIEIPVVTVTTVYPGAGPETVEREVTKKLEESINTVEGVRHIESVSQEGLSNIQIEFELEVSAVTAAEDVRGKIAGLRGDLPREIEEPIVQRIDFSLMPILSVGVNAPGLGPQAATTFADKVVKRRLENVRGVGSVALVGESTREIQVVVDRLKLEAYHVSLAEVVSALQRENVDVPAGSAERGSTEALVRVAARGRTAPDIAVIPIKRASGAPVLVRDVAQVIDGVEQPKNVALIDERPALALDIQKQSGANTVAVAEGVRDAVAKLQKEMPAGITLSIIKDDSSFIRESIEDVRTTMLIGGLLTVFIVYLFLNSWRSTVITGLTLPISVVSGFIAMRAFGFTLNVLTLMGLSLAIGMLIDDAIVVRENIVRHLQRGKGHFDAARDGTAEIGLAVMATSFTILAVFVPVAFMGGMVGRIFYEFGITVAAAVAASLFVSFTLDPMLSSRWFDPDIEKGHHPHLVGRTLARFNQWFEDLHRRYERLLGWALHHRKTVLAAAAVAFLGSFPVLGILGGDFMPDFDRGEYQVMLKSTPGSTLAETRQRALEAVRRLKALPSVDFTYTTIGEAGILRRPVTEGSIYVRLRRGHGMTFSQTLRQARQALAGVPGLSFGFTEAGPFGQKPLQYSVRGPELDELDRISRELTRAMGQIRGVADVETSLEKSKPELRVEFDRDRASDLGLNVAPVAMTLRAAVTGQVASTIEDAAGDSHDVRVRLQPDQRRYADDLLALRVPTDKDDARGDKILVPLGEVARAVPASGPSTIRRKDLQREVRISAANDGRSLQEVASDIERAGAALKLAPGYDILPGGDSEELKRMFGNMLQTLALAVIFIYLILASQFGSFFHPFAIMLSLPLSLVGVALGLLATRDSLNIMSMIGLIMLMGLVTKNAILLVDFTNQARARGAERNQALVQAGSTRLRPIVMTTLAMIFGMLPLAFALGAGAEMRAPMARAVIGGLITSTLLTLVVVPVVYTYLDSWPEAVRSWLGLRRPHETVPQAGFAELPPESKQPS
ncbi:MAG TPA: efflux RND transporter permease subunit [Vicinamibacteria bacterium]|nr:efflux RND transporter permease subunit [Vicinamibacteria bacterium]